MDRFNLKALRAAASSTRKSSSSDKNKRSTPNKCSLKTGSEIIRGVAGSRTVVNNYGTLGAKNNNTKSNTLGRSSTLGRANSTLSTSMSSTNNNNGTTNGRKLFSLKKKW